MKNCCKMFFVFIFFICIHLNAQVYMPGDSLSAVPAFYTDEMLLAGGSFFSGDFMAADKAKPSTCSRLFRESLYIGKQALYGQLFGFGFGYLGGILGSRGGSGSSLVNTNAVSGFFLGYLIGNTFGVRLAGNSRYYQTAFMDTFMGSLAGAIIGGLILSNNPDLGSYSLFVLSTIGAVISFNLSKKPVNQIKNTFNHMNSLFGNTGIICYNPQFGFDLVRIAF